jgi:hypothetical protein
MSNGSLPEYIGSIQIFDNFSTIDLPSEMPQEVLEMLQKTVVCNMHLNMTEQICFDRGFSNQFKPS